ncbi:hypothetical protein [Paenibacillus ihumii]|nr:hypothetical protein [Paenibacillus ihumii]
MWSTDRRHAAKHRALGAARGAKRDVLPMTGIFVPCYHPLLMTCVMA